MDATKHVVHLSSIFKWYADDFGKSKADRLKWLLPYLRGEQQSSLQQLLDGQPDRISVEFLPYDWSMNSS